MFNCPDCNKPLDAIDGQGLDCLHCKKFYPNHVLDQWEKAQIAINERESYEDWLLEQEQLQKEQNRIPINQAELLTEYHAEQFHSVGGVI